jgi:hypothetical protein
MSITKFNKTNKITFDVDLKEVTEWKKAKELVGKTITIKAIGYHKSTNPRYGDSVFVVATEGYGINLPSWFKDTVVEVLNDDESVQEIKNGTVGITLSPYKTKDGSDTVKVDFTIVTLDSKDLPY